MLKNEIYKVILKERLLSYLFQIEKMTGPIKALRDVSITLGNATSALCDIRVTFFAEGSLLPLFVY